MRIITLILSCMLVACCALSLRAADSKQDESPFPPATTKAEAELGAKTAEQIEKEFKLVTDDEEALARLHEICAAIAPATQRPQVEYTCKILDTGALNAMVIPGGIVYVTKGLLAAVESDDELAAVLAHEIAHNSLCHAQKMMKREANASLLQVAAIITAIYSVRSGDVYAGNILTMSELVKRSLMNGYNVDLEIEADANALDYLHKLGAYNPVGLYSVILGFRKIENSRPQYDLGYLKTHPYSDERKKLLENKLAKLGITINLWQVVDFRAKLLEPQEGDAGYTVRLGEVDLVTLREPADAADAKARATKAVEAMNRALQRDYIQQFDLDLAMLGGNAVLRMRRIPVLTLTEADALAANAALENLGQIALQRAREAIWREVVKREG